MRIIQRGKYVCGEELWAVRADDFFFICERMPVSRR